jgi:hypothetical protein
MAMKNKMKILVIICVVFLVAAGVFTGWDLQRSNYAAVQPPFDSMTFANIDNSAVGKLVVRAYNNPLTSADMQKVKDEVLAKWQAEPVPQSHVTIPLPGPITGRRYVAFGYAIGPEGKPVTYMSFADNARDAGDVYSQAEGWLVVRTGDANYRIIVTKTEE